MVVSIGDYQICDGTLAGGVAVSDLRLNVDRGFDIVIPIGEVSPVLFDRVTSIFNFVFTVKIAHASLADSEAFLLTLESVLPRTGAIKFTTIDGTSLNIAEGRVIAHQLTNYIGATTTHSYHIMGSGSITVTGPSAPHTRTIITEDESQILTEDGGTIETET